MLTRLQRAFQVVGWLAAAIALGDLAAAGPLSSAFGESCTVDAECGGELRCVGADATEWAGGGIPGGLCTKSCEAAEDCTGLVAGADCLHFTGWDDGSLCFPPCSNDPINDCSGRADMECLTVNGPVCVPQCTVDEQCGEGLVCSKGRVCESTVPPPIGDTCDSDEDCGGAPLQCLRPGSTELGGRGPAGGLCTVACATDDDCLPWDPAGACVPLPGAGDAGTQSFCLEGCDAWAGLGSAAVDPTKCQGRLDLACDDDDSGLRPVCVPQCARDEECNGEAPHCNPSSGLCQPDVYVCDEPPCGFCTVGALEACGEMGVCSASGAPFGSQGFCSRACDCSEQCPEGEDCLTDPEAAAAGALGLCGVNWSGDPPLESCPMTACSPGSSAACRGDDGCLGLTNCLADGSGYEACRCLQDESDAGPLPEGPEPVDPPTEEPDASPVPELPRRDSGVADVLVDGAVPPSDRDADAPSVDASTGAPHPMVNDAAADPGPFPSMDASRPSDVGGADASATADAAPGDAAPPSVSGRTPASGCACTFHDGARTAAPWFAWVLPIGLWLRRSRRRED